MTATLVGAKSAAQVQALSGADGWRLDAGELAEIDAILATLGDEARAAKMIVW